MDMKPADQTASPVKNAIAQKLKKKISCPCERILLINPQMISEQDFFADTARRGRYAIFQPYGCGVLCANLFKRGYQVNILDLNYELLLAAHRENFNYSCWRELLIRRLTEFKPNLVGISCMFSMSHEMVKDISVEIKKFDPALAIISGGVHFTDSKHLALSDCPDIDFMGIFENDRSFPDLVDFINGKISTDQLAQVATMIDGQYVALEERASPTAEEISVVPMYGDLPIASYSSLGQVGTYGFLNKHRRSSSVSTNRGCRAHCSFCTVPELFGRGIVRLRTIQSVIEEIKMLYAIGIRHISWLDDDLLNNSQRIIELFTAIANLKFDLTWDATNGLIAAAVKEDIMDAMVASGCVGFNLGIETGNPQRLRDIHKPGTVEGFRKCKKIADKYPHLFIKGYLIVGFPDETLSQLLDTVNLGLELQLDWYSIQILNPLPSTEIYNSMVERGLIADALNTNKTSYVFGTNGRQRITEERERMNAADFFNLFVTGNPDDRLKPEELRDILFLMDYKMNYEIIFAITHPAKLRNKDIVLHDICERVAPESPLAQLFYAITRYKLGDKAEALRRAALVRQLVAQSAYWQKRFDVLNLFPLLGPIS